ADPYADGGLSIFFQSGGATVGGPAGAGTNLTTQQTAMFSVEAWVNPISFTAIQEISGTENSAAGAWNGFALRTNNGRPEFVFGTGVATAPTSLPINQWSHVVGTFDGSTVRVYVNGLQVAS